MRATVDLVLAFTVGATREPEVEEPRDAAPSRTLRELAALRRQHDVVGLDVAVDDAAPMNVLERIRDLAEDVARTARGHRDGALVGQRLALDKLHDHVRAEGLVLAEVDDRDDVGVADLARELGLLVEPLARRRVERERRRDELERERLAELDVPGAIHLTHAAFPEATVERVATTDDGGVTHHGQRTPGRAVATRFLDGAHGPTMAAPAHCRRCVYRTRVQTCEAVAAATTTQLASEVSHRHLTRHAPCV